MSEFVEVTRFTMRAYLRWATADDMAGLKAKVLTLSRSTTIASSPIPRQRGDTSSVNQTTMVEPYSGHPSLTLSPSRSRSLALAPPTFQAAHTKKRKAKQLQSNGRCREPKTGAIKRSQWRERERASRERESGRELQERERFSLELQARASREKSYSFQESLQLQEGGSREFTA